MLLLEYKTHYHNLTLTTLLATSVCITSFNHLIKLIQSKNIYKNVLILLIHFCLSNKHRHLCISNVKITNLTAHIYTSVFKNYIT